MCCTRRPRPTTSTPTSSPACYAVQRSAEWRTIYLRKKTQGKKAKQVLIVVAVKLLHTIFAMLRDRRPYHSSRLLAAPATIGT
jgi:hypothetical protein